MDKDEPCTDSYIPCTACVQTRIFKTKVIVSGIFNVYTHTCWFFIHVCVHTCLEFVIPCTYCSCYVHTMYIPFPPSRMPASIELSIKLAVCLTLEVSPILHNNHRWTLTAGVVCDRRTRLGRMCSRWMWIVAVMVPIINDSSSWDDDNDFVLLRVFILCCVYTDSSVYC